jgi:phosphoribosylformylglycinamidine cyclo-ligase
VPEPIAGELIEISKSFSVDARIVGHVERSNDKKLTIKSVFGEFKYEFH